MSNIALIITDSLIVCARDKIREFCETVSVREIARESRCIVYQPQYCTTFHAHLFSWLCTLLEHLLRLRGPEKVYINKDVLGISASLQGSENCQSAKFRALREGRNAVILIPPYHDNSS